MVYSFVLLLPKNLIVRIFKEITFFHCEMILQILPQDKVSNQHVSVSNLAIPEHLFNIL